MAILYKFPVNSLRFRCVSKSLFRSPNLIAPYHSQNPDPQFLLTQRRSSLVVDKTYLTSLSAEFRPIENIRIPLLYPTSDQPSVYGPCNGLYCLAGLWLNDLAIWNPSTKQLKNIPPSTAVRPRGSDFNQSHYYTIGFGFDSRSGDYKVIRFLLCYYPARINWSFQLEIYCLNSNSWSQISQPKMIADFPNFCGMFRNGFYQWLGRRLPYGESAIISFDLKDECFSATTLPEFERNCIWVFVEHPVEAMALISYPYSGEEKVFNLWVKKEEWIRESTMGPFSGVMRPLDFWKNGQLFFESNNGELLLLDIERGEMKHLGIYSHPEVMRIVRYEESSIQINGSRTEQQEHIVRRKIIHH